MKQVVQSMFWCCDAIILLLNSELTCLKGSIDKQRYYVQHQVW